MAKKKKKRVPVPPSIETKLLIKCGRRCALCVYLQNDFSTKNLQIAHIDNDPSNNDLANLVPLCLDHHIEVHQKNPISKGFSHMEIKHYRDLLYKDKSDIIEKSSSNANQFLADKEKDHRQEERLFQEFYDVLKGNYSAITQQVKFKTIIGKIGISSIEDVLVMLSHNNGQFFSNEQWRLLIRGMGGSYVDKIDESNDIRFSFSDPNRNSNVREEFLSFFIKQCNLKNINIRR